MYIRTNTVQELLVRMFPNPKGDGISPSLEKEMLTSVVLGIFASHNLRYIRAYAPRLECDEGQVTFCAGTGRCVLLNSLTSVSKPMDSGVTSNSCTLGGSAS